ncbi:MAG: IS110 family RNA-guided transposase [Planctomycetota bacterium]|jgi:transposase
MDLGDGDPVMKIMALDLGKSKMVGCMYDTSVPAHRFDSGPLDRATLHTALNAEQPDRVVIEVGTSAGWVGDVVRDRGVELQVANPSHQAWRWRSVKTKTDRLDALKLAELSASDQLPQVHLPQRDVRQWRSLIRYRHRLIGRRTAIKNRIRSVFEGEGLSMPKGSEAWTQKGLATLRRHAAPQDMVSPGEFWRVEITEELRQYDQLAASIKEVERCLDAWSAADARIALLRTIPGVGPRLAEALVAVIDDPDPHRFKSGKQVAAYFGLVPRTFQSGAMSRQGRITGAGDRMVRALLVEVAWTALRYNAWAAKTFAHLCDGNGKRRKAAAVAIARRLLIRCWAMLRDHTEWSPPAAAVA